MFKCSLLMAGTNDIVIRKLSLFVCKALSLRQSCIDSVWLCVSSGLSIPVKCLLFTVTLNLLLLLCNGGPDLAFVVRGTLKAIIN